MTLLEIIRIIEGVAMQQPAVKMVVRHDIYKLNACPTARYGAFCWQHLQHEASIEGFKTFRFNLFFVDRQTADGSNILHVQSEADSVLDNIIKTLAEGGIDVQSWTTSPFNQKFSDDCAGAFATVSLMVPSSVCAEAYADFNSDYNADFLIL